MNKHGFAYEGIVPDFMLISKPIAEVRSKMVLLGYTDYLRYKLDALKEVLRHRVEQLDYKEDYEQQQQLGARITYTKKAIKITESKLNWIESA